MSIRYSILSLLAEAPSSVSELRRNFQEITLNIWPLNIGQVFQTVQRLERDGLIENIGSTNAETGHTSEQYALTPAGMDALTLWWSSPTLQSEKDRDELVIKFALAQSSSSVDVSALIQQQREAVISEIRTIVQQKATTPPDRSARRMLLERRIFNLEAEARWLDHIETLQEVMQ